MTISSGQSLPYLWVPRNAVPPRSCSTMNQLRLPFLHPMVLRLSLVPWYPHSLVLALTSWNKFSFRHIGVFFFSWSTTSNEGNNGSLNFPGTLLINMLWSRTPVRSKESLSLNSLDVAFRSQKGVGSHNVQRFRGSIQNLFIRAPC